MPEQLRVLILEDDRDGVVGIAPGAWVHNLKVLNGNGQTDLSTVIAAVEYVTLC